MRFLASFLLSLSVASVANAADAMTTGYIDARVQGAFVETGGLMPSNDSPSLANVIEGNVQTKVRFGDHGYVSTDVSLFHQTAGLFYGEDTAGTRTLLDPRDVPAFRPGVVVSEMYGSWNIFEHAHLTAGKKRIVWGPALAINPTDLVNPGKDPSDPSSQRVGAWLARLELPFEGITLSTVFAAKELRSYGGLPGALLYYPDYPSAESVRGWMPDDRDGQPHFVAAARLYALVADTDFNLIYTFSNLFNDAFDHKHRLGLTASRIIVGGLGLHGEAMFQQGSSKMYFDPDCAASAQALGGCAKQGKEAASRRFLKDEGIRVKAVAGGRYMFEDNSILSLEYYFNGEGYTGSEFRAFLKGVSSARELAVQQPDVGNHLDALLGRGLTNDGSPQKLVFDPIRRHYLIGSFQKPFVWDDFTFGVVFMMGLSDLSGMVIPSVSWSAKDWLTLTTSGYVPLASPGSLETVIDGKSHTEFGLQPSSWRVLVSARAWF